ncbi:hypothetical protein ACJIZ3_002525 [Penstemon smallii]|uniref:AP2/ERF domain-containing protein n=1 Tax=Penstemon smallii TaxID=265156 RepID=A0ABD3U9Z0_9LAMI
MAPAESNWLSFSLSSMEMLNASASQQHQQHQPHPDSNHYYSFADNFYATTGWPNHQKAETMYTETENHHHHHHQYISYDMQPPPQPPKLEDFFAGAGDSTETQDSSLTHIYDHHHNQGGAAAYFGGEQQQDLKSLSGFEAFSGNSGSEVDDLTHSPVESGTEHRWTGRYEAHLWDNSCRREGQARKGRQGGYDKEEKAARSYDLAALKYWGSTATTNFPISNYSNEIEEMKHVTKQEFIASLRRKSSGFSRGASIYRGVTRHHQQGRWQARIGRVAGNKDLYLGTFATEEEAAEAYDIAAIKFRGINAVTNFEMNRYDVEAIAKSPLPIGGAAKRLKLSLEGDEKLLPLGTTLQAPCTSNNSSNISFASIQPPTIPTGVVPYDTAPSYYHHNFFHHLHPGNQGVGSTPDNSGSAGPMTLMQSPAEFFIWPHQSY